MLQRFFNGFGFVLRGKRLLSQVPGLKVWILIPFLIDLILLVIGVYFGSGILQSWVGEAVGILFTAETWTRSLVYYLALALFWFVFILIYFYFVYIFASVVASPFYGLIAEKTLAHLQNRVEEPLTYSQRIRGAFRMFWTSLLRGLLLVVMGLFLLVASFIPGLNLLASFAAFVILAFDAADYSFEARGLGLRERFRFLRRNWPEFFGMGAFIGLTAFVPGLILLAMPFAVIGAAGVFADVQSRAGDTIAGA